MIAFHLFTIIIHTWNNESRFKFLNDFFFMYIKFQKKILCLKIEKNIKQINN